ncbi:O-antigen ligase family protein [Paraclostridium bifermentans]|uniref:O-antigen ligase family protein n=1 Tax=Paraclostridium bifermentans TaxID=1490 RepID=UPI00374FDB0E
MQSKKIKFTYMLFLILAFFVQTFYFEFKGISVKFRYFAYIIFFISVLKTGKIEKNKFDIYLFILYIYMTVNIFFSTNQKESVLSIVYLTLNILVARILFANVEFLKINGDKILKSIYIINIVGLVSYFIVFFFVGLDQVLDIRYLATDNHKLLENTIYSFMMYDASLPRYTGYILDPNFWGLYSIFMIYIIVVIQTLNDKKHCFYNRSLITSIISLGLTLSRGNIITILIIWGLYNVLMILKKRRKINKIDNNLILPKTKKIILIMIILGITIGYGVLINSNGINIEFVKERYKFSDAESSRIDVWQTYMDDLDNLKEVFIGKGLTRNLRLDISGLSKTSHNTYIFVLYNLGLIGILIFLIIPISLLIQLIKRFFISTVNCKLYAISISFTVGILVESFTIDTFMSTLIWGTFIFGYSILKLNDLRKVDLNEESFISS